ncbi:MAG: RNA pyrophosphohydrolase [Alphaproteobacteria bacterium]|nr:RNA pyrophosphohydrolase [Alphaproteobacteria bacterium]
MRLGVGMVLLNKRNQVFAAKKNTVNTKMISFFLKRPWQMPQGGIEDGETPVDAMMRELQEEIGTNNVEIIAETKDWIEYMLPKQLLRRNYTFVGQKQKWFLLKFLGNDNEINLNTTDHKEFDTWKWMGAQNIIRLSVNFKRSLYIEVFKRFKKYL